MAVAFEELEPAGEYVLPSGIVVRATPKGDVWLLKEDQQGGLFFVVHPSGELICLPMVSGRYRAEMAGWSGYTLADLSPVKRIAKAMTAGRFFLFWWIIPTIAMTLYLEYKWGNTVEASIGGVFFGNVIAALRYIIFRMPRRERGNPGTGNAP
ncbi:MAG: hypothetical protein ACREQA_20820 [Candidatus Binatia bacterium]